MEMSDYWVSCPAFHKGKRKVILEVYKWLLGGSLSVLISYRRDDLLALIVMLLF